jgi:hypothetical protein
MTKRINHIAWRLVTALSALLCVASIGLWVRSHYVTDHVAYISPDYETYLCKAYRVDSNLGMLHWEYYGWQCNMSEGIDMLVHDVEAVHHEPPGLSYSARELERYLPINDSLLSRLGFWWKGDKPRTDELMRVNPKLIPLGHLTIEKKYGCIPIWFFTTLLAMPVCFQLPRFWRRWVRVRSGRCPDCGYDLRATPERCPECGTSSAPSGRGV